MEAIQINRKQLCFCSALNTLTQCFIRRCCPQSRAYPFICFTNRNAAGFQELLEDGFWPAEIIVQQISAMERNEHPVLCRLGLMANKTFGQSEPSACPAAEQSHNVSQGCSISLGSAWGWAGTATPGDKPSKSCPLCSWPWHPISPAG